ncbi:MAG TPA: nuclear transport factor 2 family protein [Thermoanaerobaculia bacterium]|nr:nuclear transport factor 2 family protein [Thermoanaerobaculia bacterium]
MEAGDDIGPDGRHAAAEDFVGRFSEFWAAPCRDRLAAVLAPNARLVAPMTATTSTFDDGWRSFASLLDLIPDLSATVHRWGATEDGVLIEFTLAGTTAGGPISWNAVDRFTLGPDGLATERVSYFDSVPIALTILRRPRIWPGFARAQLRR